MVAPRSATETDDEASATGELDGVDDAQRWGDADELAAHIAFTRQYMLIRNARNARAPKKAAA